jgi:dethiobiotin synthetase
VAEVAEGIEEADADLVLLEGAGGLLVRFSDDPLLTFADLLVELGVPAVLVVDAGLGTLNHTALSLEAMAARGIECAGVVIGAWPEEPDLAMIENVADLRTLRERPIDGVLPAGIGDLAPPAFEMVARRSLSPAFGGEFDAVRFEERMKGLL